MATREYEFRHVSKRQRNTLIACKAAVIVLLLMSLQLLVFSENLEIGKKLDRASYVFNAMFVYVNLMTVKVEVQELFEPPVRFVGTELFWIFLILWIGSFFI